MGGGLAFRDRDVQSGAHGRRADRLHVAVRPEDHGPRGPQLNLSEWGKVLTRQVSPVITSEPVAGTGMPNPATEPSRMKPTCGSAKDVPPMKVSWGKIVVPNAATAVPSEVVAENPHPTLSATKMVSLPCPDFAASAGAAISSAIGPRFEMTTERLIEGTYGSGDQKGVAGGRANTRIP